MRIIFTIIAVLAALYLLALMPRMCHKPDKTPFQGVLYAHRGLHDNRGEAPENSMKGGIGSSWMYSFPKIRFRLFFMILHWREFAERKEGYTTIPMKS